ncbi:MAG: putative type secretion system integral rane subunit [Acidimicrobiales bacterium]|nr:putative type secretion system integral rane subunit [Acidimicrobiales bacterium]
MMRRRGALLAAAVAGALGCMAVAAAPAAFAASGAGPSGAELSIRKVDATNRAAVGVTFMYNGKPADLQSLTVREDGQAVKTKAPQDLATSGIHLGVVFAVDLSGSMADDSALSKARAGLQSLIKDLRPGDEVGVVGFNDTVTVLSELTADPATLDKAVADLTAPRNGKTAMYDGLRKAASMLAAKKDLQPNVVLVTDGPDDASTADLASARGMLVDSGAAVFAVGVNHTKEVDRTTVQGLVDRAGGLFVEAATGSQIDRAFAQVKAGLRNQYVVTYTSPATRGQVNVELALGNVTRSASYVAGSVAQGASSISVHEPPKPFGPSWLRSGTASGVGLLLIGLAFGLGAFSFINLAIKQEDGLLRALRPYSEDGEAGGGDDENQGLAQTALLQRAVEMTEDFAEKQGILVKVEGLLERADLPLRAAEALFFYGAGAAVVSLLGLVLTGIMPALLITMFAVMMPPAILKYLAGRRVKKFLAQLPDMLQLLAGSLRAGYSLMQGVEAVSQEVQEPMGKELRRVITEARLGRPVEDSLDAVAERMASKDFAWAVMAIRIQREVGGNLAELLLTVGETMVQRDRLRRDVASLTAEGKISAIVLGLLPVGLGAVMWVINPVYMNPLISTGMGKIMLGVAVTSALIGFAWMKKTITIEI